MDANLARDIALTARGLQQALEEIRRMVDARTGGEPLRELLRHAHELVDILAGCVQELRDAPEAPRALALARLLTAQLELLERDIGGATLH
jgi:hypothetical protein